MRVATFGRFRGGVIYRAVDARGPWLLQIPEARQEIGGRDEAAMFAGYTAGGGSVERSQYVTKGDGRASARRKVEVHGY